MKGEEGVEEEIDLLEAAGRILGCTERGREQGRERKGVFRGATGSGPRVREEDIGALSVWLV